MYAYNSDLSIEKIGERRKTKPEPLVAVISGRS